MSHVILKEQEHTVQTTFCLLEKSTKLHSKAHKESTGTSFFGTD